MEAQNHRRDIVVVGASAGGVEALQRIVAGLPQNLPAAVFVVIHVSAQSPRLLAQILNRAGTLPCAYAQDGEPVQPGKIYLAQPNRHLMLEDATVRLVRGPRENGHIPAVDPLFRSAAAAYGSRVVGVVLGGNLNDGTAGLLAVKQSGGTAVVQDPEDTLYPSMPLSALQHVDVDYVVPLSEIPGTLVRLTNDVAEEKGKSVPERVKIETEMVKRTMEEKLDLSGIGKLSLLSCPDCGGPLYELKERELSRYRCFIGHAYTAEVLDGEQVDQLENALWVALRTLEQNVALRRNMLREAEERNLNWLATRLTTEVEEREQSVQVIQQLLTDARLYNSFVDHTLAQSGEEPRAPDAGPAEHDKA